MEDEADSEAAVHAVEVGVDGHPRVATALRTEAMSPAPDMLTTAQGRLQRLVTIPTCGEEEGRGEVDEVAAATTVIRTEETCRALRLRPPTPTLSTDGRTSRRQGAVEAVVPPALSGARTTIETDEAARGQTDLYVMEQTAEDMDTAEGEGPCGVVSKAREGTMEAGVVDPR